MQKPALAIHAGTPKTGTTAAQLALLHGKHALDALNFSYPLGATKVKNPERFTGNAAATARALSSLSGESEHPSINAFLARHKTIKAEIATLPISRNLVLSSEFFSVFGYKSWLLFFDEFDPNSYDISVIFYMRNQLDQIQSGLGQSVKGGHRVVPENYAKRAVVRKRFLDYASLLDILRALPFAQRVLRPYERQQLVQGDIGADLFEQLGQLVGAHSTQYKAATVQERNLSLSAKGLHIKNYFNKVRPSTEENDVLLATLQKVDFGDRDQPASYIDPAEVTWISERFKEGNAFLIKELGDVFHLVARSKTEKLPFFDISIRPDQADIDLAMDAVFEAASDHALLQDVVKRLEPFATRKRRPA